MKCTNVVRKGLAALVLSGLLATPALASRTGFFAGADLGLGTTFSTGYSPNYSNTITIFPAFYFGLSAGYDYQVNSQLTLRGLLHWLFGFNSNSGFNYFNNSFTLGVNAYYTFLQLGNKMSLHAIAGLEIGYGYCGIQSGFIMPINLGVGVDIDDRQKVGFMFRIPTFPLYSFGSTLTFGSNFRDLGYIFTYSYGF